MIKLTAKRPTRKHHLCFNADFRGYAHHCSRLTWSERRYGPAGAGLMCTSPYVAPASRPQHTNPCS